MKLEPKVPVDTREPTILVEGMPAGVHRFQLVVFDSKKRESKPAFFTVEVTKETRPTR